MTQELVEEYLQSFSRLQEASDTVDKYFSSVKKIHSVLSHWQSLHVVPDLDVKDDDWPTSETVKAALSAWTGANKGANNKWDRLSEDERKGLKSPDELYCIVR